MKSEESEEQKYDQVEKLLHLKRYEQPPEGFYERFLDDLHDRQRVEIMQRSSWSLFWDRVETWFWGVGTRKRVYLAGLAYATVMIGLFFRVGDEDYQANNGSQGEQSATVAYGVGASKVPVLGDEKSSNESIVPAGIKSFLREF